MNCEQYLKNLEVPRGIIDAVLDTDTYNEIDDQFALSYMMLSPERINVKAIYAAPFDNFRSNGPKDGMERSYNEILKVLKLLKRDDFINKVYKGSEKFMSDEKTPVDSPAARHLVELAKQYSPEKPLYVVALAAITNIASALTLDPTIAENIVVVWLGGHAHHFGRTNEFNMKQDYSAARVVMGSKAPFVQLPCCGVVTHFSTTKPELEYWLNGKNPLSTYLYENSVEYAENYAKGKPWSRVIWDVTAVAWLLNDDDRFMDSRIIKMRLPTYDGVYSEKETDKLFRYVYYIKRDALFEDIFKKLTIKI